MLNHFAFFESHAVHDFGHTLGSKQTHQVVFERQVEPGLARVALAPGPAAQLVVDAPGLMALRGQHVEPAEVSDLHVLGGEGKGMRLLTRDLCDELAAIPMAGTVSSLNVSVATGIMLFEAVRQRSKARSAP